MVETHIQGRVVAVAYSDDPKNVGYVRLEDKNGAWQDFWMDGYAIQASKPKVRDILRAYVEAPHTPSHYRNAHPELPGLRFVSNLGDTDINTTKITVHSLNGAIVYGEILPGGDTFYAGDAHLWQAPMRLIDGTNIFGVFTNGRLNPGTRVSCKLSYSTGGYLVDDNQPPFVSGLEVLRSFPHTKPFRPENPVGKRLMRLISKLGR